MTTKNRRLIGLALLICFICYFQARRIRWLGELGFAMDLISELYYTKVDRKELYSAAMRGMTSELDRYSGYSE
jgi:C-terminal processing protease CtpA/Prc